MGERRVGDAGNKRMNVTSRQQTRTEASSEIDHGPEGAVLPQTEWKLF